MAEHTPGPWLLAEDAQGPCMVMHPAREGVAIASLTGTFTPTNGFHDDWLTFDAQRRVNHSATERRIAERNANARLIAAAPELLAALDGMIGLIDLVLSHDDIPAVLARALEESHRLSAAREASAKARGDG